MEQEQKVAEDARIAAERDAAEQKHAAHLLQVNSWKNFCKQFFESATFLLTCTVLMSKKADAYFFVPSICRRSMKQQWQHFHKWRKEL